ncbi:MAG: glycosyltransferase family 4 protein [Candidatus Bathyarchaeia archaeon]
MRVLLVTPSYFPIIGGAEVFTQTLAIRLNESGIHTDVMTYNMNEKWKPIWAEETIEDGGFKVFKQPAFNPLPNLPNPLYNFLRMNVIPKVSFVKKFKDYDAIHFISEADLGLAICSLHIKKPKLLHFLGIFRKGGMYKYYMVDRPYMGVILKRLIRRLADIFLVSSQEEKRLLLKIGLPEEKVHILPMGVDTEIFRPNESSRSYNLILFVGRIERIKGLHILIDALQYVDIPAHLVIIGPKRDKKYAEQIEKEVSMINKKGFHKVEFLGSMKQSDLAKWYHKASIVVCPYLVETYSNVVRESLACGTPVVSTGSHIIEDGSDGILLTAAKAKDLANCIAKLLKDKNMREKLGMEGRVLVNKFFSWQHVIEELKRLYISVINAQRN